MQPDSSRHVLDPELKLDRINRLALTETSFITAPADGPRCESE